MHGRHLTNGTQDAAPSDLPTIVPALLLRLTYGWCEGRLSPLRIIFVCMASRWKERKGQANQSLVGTAIHHISKQAFCRVSSVWREVMPGSTQPVSGIAAMTLTPSHMEDNVLVLQ